MTILNVDDDADDREIFCDALKEVDPGIVCHTEKDAESALGYLNNQIILPDLIFLDINMPRCNGTECLQIIKKDKRFRHIPIVMYSTSVSDRDLLIFKNHKAKYITKASSFQTMVSRLKETIESIYA